MNRLLLAQITNPAVPALQEFKGDSGTFGAAVLGKYIAVLIQTSAVLGGLAVLLYMFMGALQWITAGGDTGKIEKARNRILQAIIGLAVLVSVVGIATFLGPVFGLDLLQPTFINQIVGGSSTSDKAWLSPFMNEDPEFNRIRDWGK